MKVMVMMMMIIDENADDDNDDYYGDNGKVDDFDDHVMMKRKSQIKIMLYAQKKKLIHLYHSRKGNSLST